MDTTNNTVKLIEEMIDLKIRQHAGASIPSAQANPQLAQFLAETSQADRARLQQLRAELAVAMAASDARISPHILQ